MTEQVDHKAEALRLIGEIGSTDGTLGRYDLRLGAAFVHSQLAIAEGQERVAGELGALRSLIQAKGIGVEVINPDVFHHEY